MDPLKHPCNTLPQSERTRYSPNIIRSSKLFKLVPGTRRTPNREGSKVLSHLDYHFSRIDWRFHLLLDLSIGSQFLVLLAFILELHWRFFKLDFDFRSGLPALIADRAPSLGCFSFSDKLSESRMPHITSSYRFWSPELFVCGNLNFPV